MSVLIPIRFEIANGTKDTHLLLFIPLLFFSRRFVEEKVLEFYSDFFVFKTKFFKILLSQSKIIGTPLVLRAGQKGLKP